MARPGTPVSRAYLCPRSGSRRQGALLSAAQAIIARDGLIVFGAQLQFTIRYLTRASLLMYTTHTVNVPIPPGQVGDAQRVAVQLMGR